MQTLYLNDALYQPHRLERKGTRDGYGAGLVAAGERDENVVALCADLSESTRTHLFAKRFPERYFETGVAEQNLVSLAAGLAEVGKIPFAASYAVFTPGGTWSQLRVSVCYPRTNVKLVGGHAGLTMGEDGATHQALEDIAITRVLPNLTVVVPCDYWQAYQATLALAQHKGPAYLRLARLDTPIFTTEKTPFEIGVAQVLRAGTDVTIFSCGPFVYSALLAAQLLEKHKISAEVINLHTIKPLDERAILRSAAKTRAVVTFEEHQIAGGLGSAIAEVLAQNLPTPMEMLGMQDAFGESGAPDSLLKKYHLTPEHLVRAAHRVLERK